MYKTFDNEKFRLDVLKQNFDKSSFGVYKDTLLNLFSKNVPLKKKHILTNDPFNKSPFMKKHLHKEYYYCALDCALQKWLNINFREAK